MPRNASAGGVVLSVDTLLFRGHHFEHKDNLAAV